MESIVSWSKVCFCYTALEHILLIKTMLPLWENWEILEKLARYEYFCQHVSSLDFARA